MAQSEETSDQSSRPWQSYHAVYTNAKAGMEGVDKEKVQQIVYEMSKGSKYFENEQRKETYLREKIENMRGQCAKISEADLAHYQKIADRRIAELEATRDLSRVWLHVDMDAFYAAVETLSDPSLEGKPMAVGSFSMISTANYEARKYGVRAAMPGFIARKLCPELIFVPTDFKKYTYYSTLTRQVFQSYDPNFSATSLDEAYLDVTKVCKERDLSGAEVAEELRQRVHEKTCLTCSAGIAPNRMLAKVCSDINKPNGQYVLPNDRMAVMKFISSLPVRKIGGIGKVTERILKDVLGINTCKEIVQKSDVLLALFTQTSADFFLSVALGLGRTDAVEERLPKSKSNERTFSATADEAFLYQKLELAEMLSSDLQKEDLHGRTLTLKLKTASFELRTRAVTLHRCIYSSEDILKHASKLLKAELPVSIRLIGLRVSQFNEEKIGPSDPTQKSITEFISRDGFGNNMIDERIAGVNVKDDYFSVNPYGDIITDNYTMKDSTKDLINHVMNMDKVDDMLCNKHSEEIDTPGTVQDNCGSHEIDLPSLIESNLPLDRENVNQAVKISFSLSSQQQTICWVDDYKCSICGFELPPTFEEERQEHMDFHLATRLQAAYGGNSANHVQQQSTQLVFSSRINRMQGFSAIDRALLQWVVAATANNFIWFPSSGCWCSPIFCQKSQECCSGLLRMIVSRSNKGRSGSYYQRKANISRLIFTLVGKDENFWCDCRDCLVRRSMDTWFFTIET